MYIYAIGLPYLSDYSCDCALSVPDVQCVIFLATIAAQPALACVLAVMNLTTYQALTLSPPGHSTIECCVTCNIDDEPTSITLRLGV